MSLRLFPAVLILFNGALDRPHPGGVLYGGCVTRGFVGGVFIVF